MDYLEVIEKAIIPVVLVIMGYWLGNRGKRVDVDIQKLKELNIVLSNMLNSWHYLNKLSELLRFQEDENNELLFPKQYLPFIVLKSGTLNDNCFEELENSIDTLKQYDPICYFELVGIGKKFDFLKTNYILPFLQTGQGKNDKAIKIGRNFLDELLNDIETYLRITSAHASKELLKEINKKIEHVAISDYNELQENFNTQYYELIMSLLPDDVTKPTFEEFKIEFKKEVNQENLRKELDLIISQGLNEFISLMIQNPDLTIDELEYKINNRV